MSTPTKKIRKPFDPSREASPENPLPGQVFDPKTRAFKGYKPKTAIVPAGAPTVEGHAGPAPTTPRNWRDERPATFGGRVMQDLRETVSDIKDEPGEVLHRVKERVGEYVRPAWSEYLKKRREQQ